MTTSQAVSGNGSYPIGLVSSPSTHKQGAEVIYHEFTVARPLPLANTKPLSEVVARLERNKAIASRLPEARRRVGQALYGDDSKTLAAMRLQAGLSQAQLADLIGSSQPHINRIERGQNDPGTDLVVRIAAALGVSAAAVLEGVQAHRQVASEGV